MLELELGVRLGLGLVFHFKRKKRRRRPISIIHKISPVVWESYCLYYWLSHVYNLLISLINNASKPRVITVTMCHLLLLLWCSLIIWLNVTSIWGFALWQFYKRWLVPQASWRCEVPPLHLDWWAKYEVPNRKKNSKKNIYILYINQKTDLKQKGGGWFLWEALDTLWQKVS